MIGLTKTTRNVALLGLFFIALVFILPHAFPQNADASGESTMTNVQLWNDLFQLSQKEKKGLTFFIQGQSVAGVVTNVIGEEAVEVRNQTFSRIIIRLDRVDAVAIN